MNDTNSDNNIAPFTYIWAIENIPMMLTPCPIKSPILIENTTVKHLWCLEIRKEGNFIMLFIERQYDNGPFAIERYFDMALLNARGDPMVFKRSRHLFQKGAIFESRDFALVDDVFSRLRSDLLSNETLTVRFRICGMILERFQLNLCYARTLLAIQRISFLWVIKNFVSMEVGQGVSKIVMVTENSSLLVTLLMAEVNGEDQVTVNIVSSAPIGLYVKISVLDLLGRVRLTKTHSNNIYMHEIFNLFEMNELMAIKSNDLPFDDLMLRLEFVTGTGVARNEIENYRYCVYD